MSDLQLTKTRIIEGVWEGVLTNHGPNPADPQIEVTHLGHPLEGVILTPSGDGWVLRVPIPPETIAEGVQTYVIRETTLDKQLDSFALIAGDALASDIRIELDLLRAELDMLKRAFRRHCVETGTDQG